MTNLWRSIRITLVFAILLGLGYPLVITGIGQLLFPYQAQGSVVQLNGKIVGSELIVQPVSNPGLFHPRPSAVGYAANSSGASNLGPTNPALIKEVQTNLQSIGAPSGASIPPDAVESSASGLDPDISIADAMLQIPRIAKSTGRSNAELQALVNKYQENRFLGIWGEPIVNVMKLNIALVKGQGR